MRIVLFALAAAMAAAGAASAQVAAPRLNPHAADSEAPNNPATMSWSHPSLAIGLGNQSEDRDPAGAEAREHSSGQREMFRGRYAGHTFSIGSEFVAALEDLTPTQSVESGDKIHFAWLHGIAWRLGDVASVGFGHQIEIDDTTRNLRSSSGFSASGYEEESETTLLPFIGGTFRLAEWIHLGALYGKETWSFEQSYSGSGFLSEKLEGDRAVRRYGIALMGRGDRNGLHLEVYREEKEEMSLSSDNDSGTSAVVREFEPVQTDGAVAEVILAYVLLGYEQFSFSERIRITIPMVNLSYNFREHDTEVTVITLGWIPRKNFNVSLRARKSVTNAVEPILVGSGLPTVSEERTEEALLLVLGGSF